MLVVSLAIQMVNYWHVGIKLVPSSLSSVRTPTLIASVVNPGSLKIATCVLFVMQFVYVIVYFRIGTLYSVFLH
jgi:hypothetical protein